MEGETKKRGREGGEEKMDDMKIAAKTLKQEMLYQQQRYYEQQDTRQEESDESHISCGGKYVGLGVFDFPWLHDNEGMISKSDEEEYWNFQDSFSSSLDAHACPPCLYETPAPPPTKLEEEIDVWPLEGEMESVWSWMLNHPLQQPHH